MFSSQGPGKACSVGPVQTTSRQQDWARTVEGEEEKIIRVERRTVGRNILPWNLLFFSLIGRAKNSRTAPTTVLIIMYTYLIILARHYAEFLNKIDLLVGCGKILYIFIR